MVRRLLGMRLPHDVDRSLFRSRPGTPRLAQRIAAYAETADVQALGSLPERSALVAARFSRHWARRRVRSRTCCGRSACLGRRFTETDLVCIAGIAGPEVRGLVERGKMDRLHRARAGPDRFTHDIIRAAIADESARRPPDPVREAGRMPGRAPARRLRRTGAREQSGGRRRRPGHDRAGSRPARCVEGCRPPGYCDER